MGRVWQGETAPCHTNGYVADIPCGTYLGVDKSFIGSAFALNEYVAAVWASAVAKINGFVNIG